MTAPRTGGPVTMVDIRARLARIMGHLEAVDSDHDAAAAAQADAMPEGSFPTRNGNSG